MMGTEGTGLSPLPLRVLDCLRPSRSRWWIVTIIVGIALAMVVGMVSAAGIAVLIALVAVLPAAVSGILVARWLGRWAGIGWREVVTCVCWGMGVAAFFSAWAGEQMTLVFNPVGQDGVVREVLPAGWTAVPVIEEFAKAAGLVAVWAIARTRMAGPMAGAAYGAILGTGFMIVEDASRLAAEPWPSSIVGWFVSALTSPAHASFTVWTGLAVGFATWCRAPAAKAIIVGAGFAVAVGGHAMTNAAMANGLFALTPFIASVTVALGWIAITSFVLVLLRQYVTLQARVRLGELSTAMALDELDAVATYPGRRAWIGSFPRAARGAPRGRIMLIATWASRGAPGARGDESVSV